MKRWHDIAIGKKLIISVVFITLLSSVLMIGIFKSKVMSNLESEVNQKLVALSQRYANTFEINLKEVENITDSLEHEFISRLDNQELSKKLIDSVLDDMTPMVKMLAQNSTQGNTAYIYIDPELTGDIHDVYFADQDGDGFVERQKEIPKAYFMEEGTSLDTKEWWYGPKYSQESYWTKPYLWNFDNGTALTFVSYSKPLYYKGQFIGVIGSDLLYDQMIETIGDIVVRGDGFAFLIDKRDNSVVLQNGETLFIDEFVKENDLRNLYNRMISEGVVQSSFEIDGEQLISSIILLGNDWYFGLAVREASVFREFNSTVNFMIFMMLLIALLAGLSFYRFGQTITKPIVLLSQYVEELKHDDFQNTGVLENDIRDDEIGHLKVAINGMIEKIKGNILFIQTQNESLKTEVKKNEVMRKKLEIAFDALSSTKDGLLILDKELNIIYYNQSLLTIFNFDKEDLNYHLMDLFPVEKSEMVLHKLKQWHIRRDYGEKVRNFRGSLSQIGEGGEVFLASYRDITAVVHQENQLEEIKMRDLLTGLYNRFGFEKAIRSFLEDHGIDQGIYPLMLINIDQFRSINDSLGFQKANIFLKKISEALNELFDKNCILSRTNGDEFGVFIKTDFSDQLVEEILTERIKRLGNAFEVEGEKVYFNYSVGISLVGMDAHFCSEGMNNAHSALNFAKERKELKVAFFSREILEMTIENYQMVRGLREAIDEKAFEVFYQPKWDTRFNKCVGLEALARWRWNGKYVSPDVFIKVAEFNNMIIEIGEIIFDKTLLFMQELKENGLLLPVSINVSSIQFTMDYFIGHMEYLLSQYDIDADWLEIELTESTLMGNYEEANNLLIALSDKGIKTSIDDFGKGYSSLDYLKNFKVNTLKIDRAFIKDIPESDSGKIAEVIVNLSRLLGLDVIAEGVETKEQIEVINGFGCFVIQGYYISKPLEQEEIITWLKNNRKGIR